MNDEQIVYRPNECEQLWVNEVRGGYGTKRVIDSRPLVQVAFVDMDHDLATDLPVGQYAVVPISETE